MRSAAKPSARRSAVRLRLQPREHAVDVVGARARAAASCATGCSRASRPTSAARWPNRRRDRAARSRRPCRDRGAMRPACSGPAPPKASSMKSRRSWPRMVEIALIASSIFTSMMRTMPSAASSTPMPERLGDVLFDRLPRRGGVEPHPAAEEIVLAEMAEHEIAVGDGRHRRRRGRSRPGPGTAPALSGPTSSDAEAVDPRDGAAAGADGVDVHHRHARCRGLRSCRGWRPRARRP